MEIENSMKITPFWLFVIAGFCIGPNAVNACVCLEGVEESLSDAEVVFDGTVVEKKLERLFKEKYYRGIRTTTGEELTIEVWRAFKGEVDDTAVVRNSMGSCSVQGLNLGSHVYIVANLDETSGVLETNECLHSTPAGRGQEAKPALEVYLADKVPLMDYSESRKEEIAEYLERVGLPHVITGKFERAE